MFEKFWISVKDVKKVRFAIKLFLFQFTFNDINISVSYWTRHIQYEYSTLQRKNWSAKTSTSFTFRKCKIFSKMLFYMHFWLLLFVGFTFAGVWSVYIKYLCDSVPSEFLGTLQGFLHGVYWGLGKLLFFFLAGPWENVSYVICEHQRRRSACTSAQTDQCLCCSLLR